MIEVNHNHLFTPNSTLKELEKLPKPEKKLSHSEIACNLVSCCTLKGWKAEEPIIALNKPKCTSLIGLIVEPKAAKTLEEGWRYAIGMTWSYTGHYHTKLYHGLVPLEGYGIPLGIIKLRRAHNPQGRYPILPRMMEALEEFVGQTESYPRRIYQLSRWKMSKRECDQLITESASSKVIGWNRVGKVYERIGERPEYTFWEVFQTLSSIIRTQNAITMRGPISDHMAKANKLRERLEQLGQPT